MNYLLDTNVCVFVIRQKSRLVIQRLQQHQPGEVGISTITLAELRYGAEKSINPPKNHAALDVFLAPLEIVVFDENAADVYGRVRAELENQGTPIGPLDTIIAAHALSLGITMVTNNAREFGRVAGPLRIGASHDGGTLHSVANRLNAGIDTYRFATAYPHE